MELVLRKTSSKSTPCRKVTAGFLLILACYSIVLTIFGGDKSVSLFEDDATSVDHVRKLLQNLNPPLAWSVSAPTPLAAYGNNIGQPLAVGKPLDFQNAIYSQQPLDSPAQPRIEFVPRTPAEPAAVSYTDPETSIKSDEEDQNNLIFMPTQNSVAARYPSFPVRKTWYAPPTRTTHRAWIAPQVWPSYKTFLSRPTLERHDLEEWLRLRQLSSVTDGTKKVDAPSKSKILAAQALLASARASKAAAMASLSIKTGAAAAAAAAAAVAAMSATNSSRA